MTLMQSVLLKSSVASVALALLLVPQLAAANGNNASNAYGDEYGNVVLHEEGGPKIIFVGASAAKSDTLGRDIRRQVPVYKRGKGPAVISPVSDPRVVGTVPPPNTGCDSPLVIQGRGYMYGLDWDETPVIAHPGCE
ncbi:hypothetical protein [Phyllobacterium pellucidum]|uniref:hypothetical protein n=1 Tax=Phyllobacterium pellucidum TaxID=2740464 RepID=UPI001D1385E2|nr:hypothetical protein [Phyllobacterium sp. T1018]UGY10015.1 hypothetical protein LLE51_002170 [Phyllobacterium sp. T1018]